jgi:hypothetical protein
MLSLSQAHLKELLALRSVDLEGVHGCFVLDAVLSSTDLGAYAGEGVRRPDGCAVILAQRCPEKAGGWMLGRGWTGSSHSGGPMRAPGVCMCVSVTDGGCLATICDQCLGALRRLCGLISRYARPVWVWVWVWVWVCGCVGVWVCGCVYGCVGVCVGVWVCGCVYGCVGVWVCGCLVCVVCVVCVGVRACAVPSLAYPTPSELAFLCH